MPRSFIIVGKTGTFVTDGNDRFVEMDEVLFRNLVRFFTALVRFENWMKRILREDVFDVGNEKFLVLLFVMESEN